MGGSKGTAPQVMMPAPTPPPTLYRSVIPEEDYAFAAERQKRVEAETAEAVARREQMVGTGLDLARRAAQRDVLTAAAYSGSLPQAQQYAGVKEAADKALELAKERAAELAKQQNAPKA